MQEITTVPQGAASLHSHVPSDLVHPRLIRLNGDSGDVHPAALKMDEKQHVVGANPRSVSTSEERLRTDKGEVEALFRELLIGVIQFFRDPYVSVRVLGVDVKDALEVFPLHQLR